jgi:hypothetical protein
MPKRIRLLKDYKRQHIYTGASAPLRGSSVAARSEAGGVASGVDFRRQHAGQIRGDLIGAR